MKLLKTGIRDKEKKQNSRYNFPSIYFSSFSHVLSLFSKKQGIEDLCSASDKSTSTKNPKNINTNMI